MNMTLSGISEGLESQQIGIYFGAVILAVLVGLGLPEAKAFETAITPALALMLYVTFLQVPLADLRLALQNVRFLLALLTANFIGVPVLLVVLLPLLPADPTVQLGVLLVLLTPCIDYVVTFSHLGRADARLLLAATPILLLVQMLLLPVYLGLFLGTNAADMFEPAPFLHAFLWLIVIPLLLAAVTQAGSARHQAGSRLLAALSTLPVPATALVLFVVIAAMLPRLDPVKSAALGVVPVYLAFAVLAPLLAWSIARLFKLDARASRAVTFSGATRNSLVVLPLAFAVPGAAPLLPAIVVTQTLVELASELVYIRVIGRLGSRLENPAG